MSIFKSDLLKSKFITLKFSPHNLLSFEVLFKTLICIWKHLFIKQIQTKKKKKNNTKLGLYFFKPWGHDADTQTMSKIN